VRRIGLDDPPLPAAGRFPSAHQQQPPPPASAGHGASRPRSCWQPACDHARPAYPTKHRRPSLRVAQPPARLVLTRFENSSTPWSWSGPVAEPSRTWPPSGPTRSRRWRAPFGRCKLIPPPRPPTPTGPLPHQCHHPAPPTPPGQSSGRACADGAEAEARQARPQPGGEGGHHRTRAQQPTATQAALAITAPSIYQ
jgi:hypothetical protein